MATRKNMRKRGGSCMRNGRMSGGNLGQGFRMGTEMLTRGYPVTEAYNTCGAMSRPGQLSTDATSAMGKGLPGLTGGGRKGRKTYRKSRKASRKAYRKMKGGRYEASLQGAEFEALGPRGGMMATAAPLPCERGAGAYISPTESTMPARQAGGAAQLAPAPFLQEQTAGYTNEPSKWLDSVGAPIELRTPVGGQLPVPACKTTGGGKRNKKMRGGDEKPSTSSYPSYPSSSNLITNMESNPAYQAAEAQAATEGANSRRAAELRAQANAEAAAANAAAANTAAANTAANTTAAAVGGRRHRKASRKNKKASRKNRKASRKSSRKSHRKSSRKH